MLGSAIERKPKVEQVNLTGGRLLREAKVCSMKHVKYRICFFLGVKMIFLRDLMLGRGAMTLMGYLNSCSRTLSRKLFKTP